MKKGSIKYTYLLLLSNTILMQFTALVLYSLFFNWFSEQWIFFKKILCFWKKKSKHTARFQRKLNSLNWGEVSLWVAWNTDSETKGKGKAVHRLFIKSMKRKTERKKEGKKEGIINVLSVIPVATSAGGGEGCGMVPAGCKSATEKCGIC